VAHIWPQRLCLRVEPEMDVLSRRKQCLWVFDWISDSVLARKTHRFLTSVPLCMMWFHLAKQVQSSHGHKEFHHWVVPVSWQL